MFTYYQTAPETDMYVFDQWARQIVQGDILGRETYLLHHWKLEAAAPEKWMEWYGKTPVFLKAPLYPYLIALCYWLFGEAMLPMAVLQIGASSVSTLLIFRITERLFERTAAFLAALLFALYAPAIHYDVFMLRGSWIVLVSLVMTHQLMNLHPKPTAKMACALGFIVGIAVVLNEGFLMLPPLVAFLLLWWFRDMRLVAKLETGFLLGFSIAYIPLMARNLEVGVPALSLSALGGTIFATSNAADTYPYSFHGTPPSFVSIMDETRGDLLATAWATLRTFKGDIAAMALFYLRKATGLVIPFEYPDNANFYYAVLKDPFLSFLPGYSLLFPLSAIGAAFALRKPRNLSILFPVTFSLITGMMASHPNSRYRVVLAVYLLPFAGLALAQLIHWTKERKVFPVSGSLAASLAIFLAAKTLQEQIVFRGLPIELVKYRALEFWIGSEVYAREQRFHEATVELLQLAQLNPNPRIRSRALLGAASHLVHEGSKSLAQQLLEYASRISGADPDFLMQIGDFHLKIFNDARRAAIYYRKALALQPSISLREKLRQRLTALEDKPQAQ